MPPENMPTFAKPTKSSFSNLPIVVILHVGSKTLTAISDIPYTNFSIILHATLTNGSNFAASKHRENLNQKINLPD